MLKIDEIDLNENEQIILRYLYMQDTHQSKSDIADSTDLSIHQVRYAMRTLDCKEMSIFDVNTDANSGDIPDTRTYMVNDRGRELVRNRNLKTSKSVENSDRIDTLENEIKNVKESVNNLRYEIEKIKEFDSELSQTMESAVNEHETRLRYIESVLDEEV